MRVGHNHIVHVSTSAIDPILAVCSTAAQIEIDYRCKQVLKVLIGCAAVYKREMTSMDLRQLTTFRHLARNLSFSRTADELSYAQSTVSAQIQTLEQELGVILFDRLGKRVLLTPVGHQLLTYAERLLDLEEETRATIGNNQTVTGEITIYAPSTLCIYRLPTILRTYRQRYSEVRINIHANISSSAVEQLRMGHVDIAFDLNKTLPFADIESRTLIHEPLVFVASPDHELVTKPTFELMDLTGHSLVLTEPTCTYRLLLEEMAANQGISLETPMSFENVEAIKQCVKAGLGLSFLPSVAVATDVAEGKLIKLPWVGESAEFHTQMVWHRDKWLSPALGYLIEVAEEVYGSANE